MDLGAVVGRVVLEDVEFQRVYVRVVRQFSSLGGEAGAAAGGTAKLDESLVAVATSASRASTSVSRASKSAAEVAAADQKAALAADRHAAAEDQLAIVMGDVAGMTTREQKAVLSLLAAHENLSRVEASQTATLTSLARAQAAVIGADDRLTAAQNAAAASAEREAAAMRAAAASSIVVAGGAGKATSAFGGLLKTAAELGLVIGGIELVKKGAEFVMAGKELTTSLNSVQAAAHASDAQMTAVRSTVIGLGHDLTVPRATAVDAAGAIDDLVRAGVRLPKALGEARYALLLAAAATTDTADAARVLGDVMDEFKLPASQAAKTADVLASAATSSAGGLMGLFQAFTYVGTRARSVGLGVQDIATAITDLSKAGITADRAGTGLAMMLQRVAHESAPGQKALTDLGIAAFDAQGRFKGLPSLIDGLSSAQKRFGVNSQRFVSDVSVAFGARAANVAAAFALKGVESYDAIYKRLSSGDVQRAADLMNRGFGAAMGQISKQLTAAGIDVYQHLEPALADAAMWLGTSVPHAISVLAQILGPTVHLVGVGLVGAWHAVTAILGPIVGVLGDIGHFLAENKQEVTGVITVLGTMWAAWKAATIATAALRTINGLLVTMRLRAMMAGSTGASSISAWASSLSAVSVAAAGIGVVLGAGIYEWQKHKQVAEETAAAEKAVVDGLTAAIQQDSDAIGKNTRAWVENHLQQSGAFDMADKLGLAYGTVTDAALGNVRAQKILNDALDAGAASGSHAANGWASLGVQVYSLNTALGLGKHAADQLALAHNRTYQSAIQAALGITKNAQASRWAAIDQERLNKLAGTTPGLLFSMTRYWGTLAHATDRSTEATKRAAAATHWVVGSTGQLVQSTGNVAKASDRATGALKAQTIASQQLKLAQDLLNGVNESLETATDSLSIGLGNLRNKTSLATDAAGNQSASLKQNTVVGATNRQMLVGLIDAAKTQAQAVADSTAKHKSFGVALLAGNKQLKSNEDAIRSAAAAAGMDKGKVDDLITSLGIISKIHAQPKVDLNTDPAKAKAAAIQAQVDSFRQHHKPLLDADPTDALHHIADIQNGLAGLHDKTIYIDAVQRVLGTPIPRATGGMAYGPSGARGYAGMVSGPGSGTSDTAGIYKLSNREFVSTAMSVARNAGALEAGNRGATLVAVDGLARKLGAASARASVPVSRPVPVSAPVGGGTDWGPVLRRLDAIERRLADAPALTGAAVGQSTLAGYREGGKYNAREMRRLRRGE